MIQHEARVEVRDETTLGLRLRRAREARGLGTAAVASALHLPQAIIEAMEREDIGRLGAPIYVRGNYQSYARLVDVPTVVVDAYCAGLHSAPQPLAPTTHVPRSRILLDRYLKRSVYVAMTALLVPSVIWLASLERSAPPVQTLLEPGVGHAPARQEPSAPTAIAAPLAAGGEAPSEDPALRPVKAALTPAYPLPDASAGDSAQEETISIQPASDLVLRFDQDSWYEVLSQQGERIDSGIAPAGSERSFPSPSVGKVSLGNAGGVRVSVNGKSVDLVPFRRANVARFALSSSGSITAADG